MRKKAIIREIEKKTGSIFYPSWFIGVTDNPAYRRNQHKTAGQNVIAWSAWPTNSEREGREIVEYFLEKGMQIGGNGDNKASFIYIF